MAIRDYMNRMLGLDGALSPYGGAQVGMMSSPEEAMAAMQPGALSTVWDVGANLSSDIAQAGAGGINALRTGIAGAVTGQPVSPWGAFANTMETPWRNTSTPGGKAVGDFFGAPLRAYGDTVPPMFNPQQKTVAGILGDGAGSAMDWANNTAAPWVRENMGDRAANLGGGVLAGGYGLASIIPIPGRAKKLAGELGVDFEDLLKTKREMMTTYPEFPDMDIEHYTTGVNTWRSKEDLQSAVMNLMALSEAGAPVPFNVIQDGIKRLENMGKAPPVDDYDFLSPSSMEEKFQEGLLARKQQPMIDLQKKIDANTGTDFESMRQKQMDAESLVNLQTPGILAAPSSPATVSQMPSGPKVEQSLLYKGKPIPSNFVGYAKDVVGEITKQLSLSGNDLAGAIEKARESYSGPQKMFHATLKQIGKDLSVSQNNSAPFEGGWFRGTTADEIAPRTDTPIVGHYTKDTDLANAYAAGDGGNVMPVDIRQRNMFDARNPDHLRAAGYDAGDQLDFYTMEQDASRIKNAGFSGYLDYVNPDDTQHSGVAMFNGDDVRSSFNPRANNNAPFANFGVVARMDGPGVLTPQANTSAPFENDQISMLKKDGFDTDKIMYHGSNTPNINEFRLGNTPPDRMSPASNNIWFASRNDPVGPGMTADLGTAQYYGDHVTQAYLKMKNPLKGSVDELHMDRLGPDELKAMGYDGFIDVRNGSGYRAVVDPSQIHIINNSAPFENPGRVGGEDPVLALPNPERTRLDNMVQTEESWQKLEKATQNAGIKRNKDGRYIGGPPGVLSPQKRAAVVAKYDERTQRSIDAGIPPGYFYEQGSKALARITDNSAEHRIAAKVMGPTSTQVGPYGNTNYMVSAFDQKAMGIPSRVTIYPNAQRRTVDSALAGEDPNAGYKVDRYSQLLGPQNYPVHNLLGNHPPNDQWEGLGTGWPDQYVPSGPTQVAFSDDIRRRATDRINLRRANEGKPPLTLPEVQELHWAAIRAESDGRPLQLNPDDTVQGSLEQLRAQAAWEAEPGKDTGMARGNISKEDYADLIFELVADRQGKDRIQSAMGGRLRDPIVRGTGVWEGELSPGFTTPSYISHTQERGMEPASFTRMDTTEAVRQYLLGQSGRAFSFNQPTKQATRVNIADVDTGGPPDPAETARLQGVLGKFGIIQPTASGYRAVGVGHVPEPNQINVGANGIGEKPVPVETFADRVGALSPNAKMGTNLGDYNSMDWAGGNATRDLFDALDSSGMPGPLRNLDSKETRGIALELSSLYRTLEAEGKLKPNQKLIYALDLLGTKGADALRAAIGSGKVPSAVLAIIGGGALLQSEEPMAAEKKPKKKPSIKQNFSAMTRAEKLDAMEREALGLPPKPPKKKK